VDDMVLVGMDGTRRGVRGVTRVFAGKWWSGLKGGVSCWWMCLSAGGRQAWGRCLACAD